MIKWVMDFKGKPTRLGLSYALRLTNLVHSLFYGISTFIGYLMPSPFLYK